jgi:hypothetical protein
MISFEILKEEGIVIVEPSGPLRKEDFEKLTGEVDTYINEKGFVKGIIIHTKSFPGWDNFSAFINHVKFVKDHHRKIRRVAAVTDSKFLTIVPNVARHFVAAEIKHFDYGDMEIAKKWIKEAV